VSLQELENLNQVLTLSHNLLNSHKDNETDNETGNEKIVRKS